MQKVISVNLNGRAYQVDEDGYAALVAYLDTAGQRLADNPDRAEILRDLEQAIADKCDAYLSAHKTVVSAAEIAQIVLDMGPVETEAGEPSEPAADAPAGGASATDDAAGAGRATGEPRRRRLYRIREGAHFAGVCNGLGAYFDLDAHLVRVAFIMLAVFTGGVGALAYVALMFIMPEAQSPEEFAAATGLPSTAKDVVDRARRAVEDLGSRGPWREHRRWRRWHGHAAWAGAPPPPALSPAPLWGILSAALAIVLIVQVVSIVNDHTVFGWLLPAGVPAWAALLVLLAVYAVVSAPLHRARLSEAYPRYGFERAGDTVIRILIALIVFSILVAHGQEVGEFFRQLPVVIREFVRDVRSVF